MIIQSAQLRQTSTHEKLDYFSRTETLKVMRSPKRYAPPTIVSAQSASRTERRLGEAIEDLKFRLLKRLLEALTGKKVEVVSSLPPESGGAAVLPLSTPLTVDGGAAAVPIDIEYTLSERRYEAESLSFSSVGTVKTADGREINVDVELRMSREFYSEINLRLVNGKKVTDPLVVNFEGPAAALTGEKFSFDLYGDGTGEEVSRLAGTSGYLALDKNGDGTVNDGTELFGPVTGDGFAELKQYDADKNGWIDEADPVFKRLRVWVGGGGQDGGKMLALMQVGVGAISLQNLRARFDIKDSATQELLGSARSASVFLREDGGAGTVQQLDLAV